MSNIPIKINDLLVSFHTLVAMDFINEVVVITGASSGIGAATDLLYAKQSANLVLVGRNEEALINVAKQWEKTKGIKPLAIRADLIVDDNVKIL